MVSEQKVTRKPQGLTNGEVKELSKQLKFLETLIDDSQVVNFT